MTTTITPLLYSLTFETNPAGNSAQEKPFKSVNGEYPFQDLAEETHEHYAARTYLQFLWLPQSIMPLNLLVPSLLRIAGATSPSKPHPLHAPLEPLLLTARSTSDKYQVELPRILADGGGSGEMEESMMWFALNHENGPEHTRLDASDQPEGPWMDEKWRKEWLERMERREVQIQILLYMLKLSLPGPTPPPETHRVDSPTSSPVKRRRQRAQPKSFAPSVEDRLESFMDKLSMWQLVHGLGSKEQDAASDARDWMQKFCEEIVEREFKSKLPDQCGLLRSKVFNQTPFSDEESLGRSSRPASPTVDALKINEHKKLAPEAPKRPSGSRQASVSARRPRERSKSRSLSVCLAEEADARRARSMSAGAKRLTMNREISMSRVFKPKNLKDGGGAKVSSFESKAAPSVQEKSLPPTEGVVLVNVTPEKKIKGVSKAFRHRDSSGGGVVEDQDGGEEMWDIRSSPDILLLGDTTEDDDQHEVYSTPTKKGKGKK